jgi:Domain of unknown function (DUF4389)
MREGGQAMVPHVDLHVSPSSLPNQRFHVVVRLLLLMALGSLGWGGLYWGVYLAAPAIVALMVSSGGGLRYLAERGPVAERALQWLASAYAYMWLLTDEAPGAHSNTVHLSVERHGTPTTSSALLRIVGSIPALFLLMLCSVVASVLWIVGALMILVAQRLPAGIAGFLELVLRYQFRWMTYHLSLVDEYPSLQHGEHGLHTSTQLPV